MIRVLAAVYYFPPAPVNSYRWVAMARHLREFGVEVTILTTRSFGTSSLDHELSVIRTGDAAGSPALRRLLRRQPVSTAADALASDQPSPRVLTRSIVPDPLAVSWNPWAVIAANRLLGSRAFDCFVTSIPANSTALLGPVARKRSAWLCDFRDPWRFEDLREGFPTAIQERIDDRLERFVLAKADAITTVQRAVADYVLSRSGRPAVYVPNGWDPQQLPAPVPHEAEGEPGTFRIVHTGSLSGEWGRSPRAFLSAFADTYRRFPHVRLLLAGRLTQEDDELVRRLVPAAAVQTLGYLGRSQAVALQRSADLLVVVGTERRSEFPGKTLEYLAAQRPILVLGQASEAAEAVRTLQAGISVGADDEVRIGESLVAAIGGRLPVPPSDLGIYAYPKPAEAMARAIQDAVSRSSRRR